MKNNIHVILKDGTEFLSKTYKFEGSTLYIGRYTPYGVVGEYDFTISRYDIKEVKYITDEEYDKEYA